MRNNATIQKGLAWTLQAEANSMEDAGLAKGLLCRGNKVLQDSGNEPSTDVTVDRIPSYYKSPNKDFTVIKGDCVETLSKFDFNFDMVFADPPYFLSGGGISCQSGKIVCVDKGEWDKPTTTEEMDAFNLRWLAACREHMKDNGAPDKPCGVGCADVNPKTVAKRYMIVQKVVSLHYESEWQ